MDPSVCPDPCTGEVVTYYWSLDESSDVFLLDTGSADAEDDARPCWMGLFEAVKDGPPAGGVDAAVWEELEFCTEALVEEVFVDGDGPGSGGGSDGDSGSSSSSGEGGGGGEVTVVAAVLIPVGLVSFAVAAFGLLRHQRRRWAKKMKTTDEAWGGGLGGNGNGGGGGAPPSRPRPPTGRFKLALVAQESMAVTDADSSGGDSEGSGIMGIATSLTDVSIDDHQGGVGVGAGGGGATAAAGGAAGVQQQQQQHADVVVLVDEEAGGEGMVYPL